MTLVFDENLSPRLPDNLSDLFNSTTHIEQLGLKGRDDTDIWERVKDIQGAVIVSKDDDFRELALAFGPPPKVLLLCIGNCSTKSIEILLRKYRQQIQDFIDDPDASLLEFGA